MRFKQIKYVFFALICMCVTPLITHAECDYQRQAELNRLASNVKLAYVYSDNGFQVIMTNLTNDLYATNLYESRINGGAERTFNYSSGTVDFDIYSNDPNCPNELLITKSITLPVINMYYDSGECKQYPNFKYCQMWGEFNITDEQFQNEFNQYVSSLKTNVSSAKEGKSDMVEVLLDTLQNNIFMLVLLGIVIIITIIGFHFSKKRRR